MNKKKTPALQHCGAALSLSLLTETKSRSNFPSWKCFSIDPAAELIGFRSRRHQNQIKAEDACGRA